ncbi:hypothetical protein EDD18DRAFT_1356657 [Armillaria luteobubalina]|uniref:Uncharacterized protein n=1 Tax=Armillaria luteobubalina TaxID=153913 RepID=A0AA39PZW4_9AGAR|nr:hypothetical protein EDD18DRAFT_1356657 [Armillaria luteobubalina]
MENNFDVCCTGLPTNFGIDPSPALPPRLNSPSASPSSPGATTSQRCWEQAQPLAAGLSEDFDDMGDALPFLPEMASSSEPEPPVDYIQWILESGINQGDIDALLMMMIKRGGQVPYHRELIAMWKKAAHLHTSFESSTFTVPLQGQPYEFTVYHRDLWSWMLDILQDPLLAPYLNWDAQ